MGNTFLTPTEIAMDAAIGLSNRLTVANHVARDKEVKFTSKKIGQTLTVTVPPVVSDASEFSGTTTAEDLTETSIDLTLEKHYYKRADLTTAQMSYQLSDFTRNVTMPFMDGVADSIDKFVTRNMQVFRANLAGTVGNRPSTIAHLAAGTKTMTDNRISRNGRIALIDTTVESSFSQLAQFQSRDYANDSSVGEGMLGRRYWFNFVTDPNL